MNRIRCYVAAALLCHASSADRATAAESAPSAPNIVLIFCDDKYEQYI